MMSSEKQEASPEASPLKGPAPKAVPEDTSDVAFEDGIPLNPMAGDPSVQFIPAAPTNGDAKVEIGEPGAPPTFVGLGKEELMKYANDPFWVRLRWLLFVLFWVLWIAMLVGAVVIIVYAPRCAEKKTATQTFYQIKAADLVKNNEFEAQTKYLQDLGVQTIVIADVLQHAPGEPEAVTDFTKFDQTVNVGLFGEAVKKLRTEGMKVLLQFVPNHSGTQHEWFNSSDHADFYIRKPFAEVQKSIWTTQDNNKTAWTLNPVDNSMAYLQQWSGNLADLNFATDAVISHLKDAVNTWRSNEIDGFVISKASYLMEDLAKLDTRAATKNQAENPGIVSRIVGQTPSGPVLVEIDDANPDTIKAYIDKGLTPVIKSFNTLNVEKVREVLEELRDNPKVVINLSKLPKIQDKARLINMLVIVGGSHALVNHESSSGDIDFLKELVKFQESNHRGKSEVIEYHSADNVIAALRSDGDEHVSVANFGDAAATFDMQTFNITRTGTVALATPNAQQKSGNSATQQISLNPRSGVVIKLDDKPEATA